MTAITTEQFEDLYKNRKNKLLSQAFNILKDRGEAQDTVQKTFLALFKQDYAKIEHYIDIWLFSVCKNTALRRINKRNKTFLVGGVNDDYAEQGAEFTDTLQRYRNALKADCVASPLEELERKEKIYLAMQALAQLEGRARRIIELYIQGVSNGQIAKEIGITKTNTNYIISITKKKLQGIFYKLYEQSKNQG